MDNMQKLFRWELAGGVVVIVVGALLHFVYGWSGQNPVVGALVPVNESTWEHLKLLIVPMLIFTLVEYFAVGKQWSAFLPAKALAILLGMAVNVTLFYTYSGIVGKNFLWADILTFVIAVACSYRFSWIYLNRVTEAALWQQIAALCVLGVVLVAIVAFTYAAPRIGLFEDPVTHTYGMVK